MNYIAKPLLSALCYIILGLLFAFKSASAITPIPFEIENNSTIPDNELYVAIVGKDLTQGAHVWVNLTNGVQMPMDPSYNTIKGPEYGGNKGPGANGMYADCFFKLSDIPNKTVSLDGIQGCRMFIGIKSQLYLYFFGSTGAQQGYAAPSHSNPTDPNTGLNYEIIELTYNSIGFWGNTSRVDSYNYAMGLELTSTGGSVIKTGELHSHADIGTLYLASVPDEFKKCYDATTGQIHQPTKTKEFSDGSVGTMPDLGPYRDYMQPYIDAIWSKYVNEDLKFIHPEIGTWSGRVSNNRFTFTCIAGPAGFIGKQGIISGKPNTQEAFEGKGVLDERVNAAEENGRYDLMMQAQICAALTRHVIDVNAANGTVQNWSDPSKYYLQSPCNHYAKFWHQQGIRVNQLAYGFAYDDVNEQSSTMHSPNPTKIKVVFGGYASKTPILQTPYGGTAHPIPGTIQAEDYDNGGTGVAFSDESSNNEGNSTYRNDAVDIETNATGHNIGYIAAGEWLEYTVDVTATANYTAAFTVAAEQGGGNFEMYIDGVKIVNSTATGTSGGWQTWKEVTVSGLALTKGEHIIQFKAVSSGFNFDKMVFSSDMVLSANSFERPVLSIYPNPANDVVFVSVAETITQIQVYDLQGNLVQIENSPALLTSVNVSGLASGSYFLKVFTKNTNHSVKFIKN